MTDYVVECNLKNDDSVEIIEDLSTINEIELPNLFRILLTTFYLAMLYKTYSYTKSWLNVSHNNDNRTDNIIYVINVTFFILLILCLSIYFIDITSPEFQERLNIAENTLPPSKLDIVFLILFTVYILFIMYYCSKKFIIILFCFLVVIFTLAILRLLFVEGIHTYEISY